MTSRIAVIIALLLIGCQGERGPMGPQGLPGQDGQGYDFYQFGGSVPTTGEITVTVPNLNMDCPPLIVVYMETSPGTWVEATILDSYGNDGTAGYNIAIYYIHDGNRMTIGSTTAVLNQRPIPFIVTIFAPDGYFAQGYQCH